MLGMVLEMADVNKRVMSLCSYRAKVWRKSVPSKRVIKDLLWKRAQHKRATKEGHFGWRVVGRKREFGRSPYSGALEAIFRTLGFILIGGWERVIGRF